MQPGSGSKCWLTSVQKAPIEQHSVLGSQHKDHSLELGALSLVDSGGPGQLQLGKLCGAKVGHISHLACRGQQETHELRRQP